MSPHRCVLVATSDGHPADRSYRIKLTWPDGRRRYTVKGRSPDVTPIHDLLDRIARRRLDDFLDTLPKPDLTSPDLSGRGRSG